MRSVVAAPFVVTPAVSTLAAGASITLTIRTVEPLLAAPTVSLAVAGGNGPAISGRATLIGKGLYRFALAIPATPGPATLTVRGTDTLRKVNTATFAVKIQ
jgi:hypothetical protein